MALLNRSFEMALRKDVRAGRRTGLRGRTIRDRAPGLPITGKVRTVCLVGPICKALGRTSNRIRHATRVAVRTPGAKHMTSLGMKRSPALPDPL